MLCSNYEMLSHAEKITLVGEVVHILQSDNEYFNKITMLLNEAHRKGVMEGVTLLPETEFKVGEKVYYEEADPVMNATIKIIDNVSQTAFISYYVKVGNKPTSENKIVGFSEIKKITPPPTEKEIEY